MEFRVAVAIAVTAAAARLKKLDLCPRSLPTRLNSLALPGIENMAALEAIIVKIKLRELAELCDGEVSGDVEAVISGAASLAEATSGEITFYGNPRYLAAFRKTRASAAFVPQDFTEQIVGGQIRVENPTKAFEQVVLRFAPQPISFAPGIHSSAVVAPEVSLGKDVSSGLTRSSNQGWRLARARGSVRTSYVGHETTIGAGSLIYPNVTIRERTRIGERVIIHSGTVIGSDGFGFEMAAGGHKKVPQIGIVQIDDDVEIGAKHDDRSGTLWTHLDPGRGQDRQPGADRDTTWSSGSTRSSSRRSGSRGACGSGRA